MKIESLGIKNGCRLYPAWVLPVLVLCTAMPSYGQDVDRPEVPQREDADVQRIASTYYAKKYNVSLTEAERRLAIQDRAAGIADDIVQTLGDNHSGIWFDHADRGRLKIGVTPAALKRSDEVRRIADRYGVAADTDLVNVRFSLADLEKKQNVVRRKFEDMIKSGHAKTGLDTKTNQVILTALAKLPPREEARMKSIATIVGVALRRIDEPTLRIKLTSCNVTFCDPPFRGGREFKGTPMTCTAAFMARNKSSPAQFWAMTAAHCIWGNNQPWLTKDEAGVWRPVGHSAFFNFGGVGGDIGIFRISEAMWTSKPPLPAVIVKTSANEAANTTFDSNYAIKASRHNKLTIFAGCVLVGSCGIRR